MKKKKSKKKLLIGAGVIAVVAVGGVSVLGGRSSGEEAVPQVEVVKAEIGDVQQTVEASGTVVSEESKTYFSPVNAKVDKVDFKEGDTVKAGTELVAFDKKDLEREQKKADLNVESGKLDMTNTINKSRLALVIRLTPSEFTNRPIRKITYLFSLFICYFPLSLYVHSLPQTGCYKFYDKPP